MKEHTTDTSQKKAGTTLEENILGWMRKVLAAYEAGGMTDTRQMITDIDRIVADGFERDPLLVENLDRQMAGPTM